MAKNKDLPVQSTFNLRPTMKGLIIHRNSPNLGELLPFGIEASWKPGMLLINARSETIAEKRTYKGMFENTRCLVACSGYFEWKKEGAKKQPYYFKLKNDQEFALAGIYKPNEGFLIITTEPNPIAAKVHNRMPAILPRELEQEWLNEDKTPEELLEMLAPYPEEEMISYPVSTKVNSVSGQGEVVIKPI